MSEYRHSAALSFTPSDADYLEKVLGPEIGREVPKCRICWVRDGDRGSLVIEAEDLSGLRAALNSYIRWTYLALNVRKKAAGRPAGGFRQE